jgi:hypothetical protein
MIYRREFLYMGPALLGLSWGFTGHGSIKSQNARILQPIPEPHFPSRLYQFVWRNWELANTPQMAKVIKTSQPNVLDLGYAMGLPKKRELTPDQLRRLYITVIRQNWHLLPESQIIELLGWDRRRFEFTLKEDDFLNIKLGMKKPECPEIIYQSPSARERDLATQVRKIIQQTLGPTVEERGEDLFHFVRELSGRQYLPLRDSSSALSEEHVNLGEGWSVVMPRQPILSNAARRFVDYLRNAMGAEVQLAAQGEAAKKSIKMEIAAASDRWAEGFQVSVGGTEVRVTGHDEREVMQGLYWLQDQMEQNGGPLLVKGLTDRQIAWNPRYLYSYFALYGDPLIEAEVDVFPNTYLEKLARAGINGVWIQAVLNTLAPSKHFPEFGAGSETRLRNLDTLIQRAKQFGVKVYLYINEPRAMPKSFFKNHPEIKGSSHLDLYAMCTSVPVVREWIRESLAHVVQRVPDLGGVFCITMSENFTNCFSHGETWGKNAPQAGECPRCSKRRSWEVIGELIQTFRDGVRQFSPTADVIVWDWGWGDALSANLIPILPRDIKFLGVSEWDQPIQRGGVETKVGEYSISVVGPGPRAKRNWELARKYKIATMAKVQFNNTWEISAVPYIPVLHLILEHCENLSSTGIAGIMASWTLGGYPSPNLAAAKAYYFKPRQAKEAILATVAAQRYGRTAGPNMIEGWRRFSQAFQEFPYGVAVYTIPTQHGPANLLRFHPTGYSASMILFPQDDLKGWLGAYPAKVAFQQFTKMASLWKEGLTAFRAGAAKAPQTRKVFAEADLAIAETCYRHFQSTANQIEFYMLREKLQRASREEKPAILDRMRTIAEEEIDLAKRQFLCARRHSIIAYEASNHYYYTPLDLVEKILNCRYIIDRVIPSHNN